MQTTSHISAAALAAAMIISPQAAQAQLLGVDVDFDVLGIEADAEVEVGGESLVDADVSVGSDSSTSGATGSSGSDSLINLDVGNTTSVGPNGGRLIDLRVGRGHNAVLDAGVDAPADRAPTRGPGLISGDIRLAALRDADARKQALLELIDEPGLADIDLDAVVDDRRVAIIAAADLLGPDSLADVRAAIAVGGDGRSQLRDALAASVELDAILQTQGIDLDDVLAVQVHRNGVTEVIVLEDVARVALLGDNGNLADVTAADVANLDIDLLSREELAEIDLELLPDDLRTTAQLRLLGIDGNDAELTPGQLANVDLDLLSDEELAEFDLALLPDELATVVQLRLLDSDDDSTIADLSVADLADLDVALLPGTGTGAGGDDGTGSGGNGDNNGSTEASEGSEGTGGNDDASGDGGTDGTGGDAGGNNGGTDGGAGNEDANGGAAGDDGTDRDPGTGSGVAAGGTAGNGAGVIGTLPATPVGASFGIAALGCNIGVLALANGVEADPQAIARAETLELVRIEGCQQAVVQSDVDQVRAAIAANPAISDALEDAAIPLPQVVGATVQQDTLTLFIAPTLG